MPTVPVNLLRTFRVLAASLMAAPVVIGIALSFMVYSHPHVDRSGHLVHPHTPGVWMYGTIVALGVIVAGLAQTFGYRIPALQPGLDSAEARASGLRLYQTSAIRRFALSELVVIVAIVLLFVGRSNTILPYVVAAAITELLMAYHVWPSERLIDRVQQRLDRDGGRSDLANALNGTAALNGTG